MQAPSTAERPPRSLIIGLVGATVLLSCPALITWTVLPAASADLHGDSLYGLTTAAGALGSLGTLVYAGYVLDHVGCRRVARWGVLLSIASTFLMAGAPSMEFVAAGQFLYGTGVGFLTAAAMASVSIAVPATSRPRVLAIMSSVWFPAAVVFPQLASLLRHLVNWRLSFAVFGVVSLIMLLLVRVFPERSAHVDGETPSGGRRAALIVTAGVALFVVSLNVSMPPVLAGVVLVISFFVLVPPLKKLLPDGVLTAKQGIPAAVAVRGTWGLAVLSLQAFETLALVRVLDAPSWLVGVALAAVELGVATGGWIFSRVHDRFALSSLLRWAAITSAVGAVCFCCVIFFRLPAMLALVPMFVRHVGWGTGHNGSAEAVTRLAMPATQGRTSAAGNVAMTTGFTLGPGLAGVAFANVGSVPDGVRGAVVFATIVSVTGFALIATLAERTNKPA